MAGFIFPAISAVGSIVGGILGSGSARKAGQIINARGQGVANTIINASQEANQNVGQAVTAGQEGVGGAVSGAQGNLGTQVGNAQGYLSSALPTSIAGVNSATDAANATLQGGLQGVQSGLNPYYQVGNTAAGNYQNILQNPFQAPTAEQARATPGYQFTMNEGSKLALQQANATGGSAAGGGVLKALTQYGQNLADTYYGNAFNRALQTYGTNANTALAGMGVGMQANQLGTQATEAFTLPQAQNTMGAGYYGANLGYQTARDVGGLGIGGAVQSGNWGIPAAQWQGNTGLQGAEWQGNTGLEANLQAGNFQMQGAGGLASGKIGAANAWNGALGGATNSIGMMPGMVPNFGFGSGNPYFGGGGGGVVDANWNPMQNPWATPNWNQGYP